MNRLTELVKETAMPLIPGAVFNSIYRLKTAVIKNLFDNPPFTEQHRDLSIPLNTITSAGLGLLGEYTSIKCALSALDLSSKDPNEAVILGLSAIAGRVILYHGANMAREYMARRANS